MICFLIHTALHLQLVSTMRFSISYINLLLNLLLNSNNFMERIVFHYALHVIYPV